jgi:hypothetical protein
MPPVRLPWQRWLRGCLPPVRAGVQLGARVGHWPHTQLCVRRRSSSCDHKMGLTTAVDSRLSLFVLTNTLTHLHPSLWPSARSQLLLLPATGVLAAKSVVMRSIA